MGGDTQFMHKRTTPTVIAGTDCNSYRQYSLDRHPALRCGIAQAAAVINGWFDNPL